MENTIAAFSPEEIEAATSHRLVEKYPVLTRLALGIAGAFAVSLAFFVPLLVAARTMQGNGIFDHQIIVVGMLLSLMTGLGAFNYFEGFQTGKSTVPTKAELGEKLAIASRIKARVRGDAFNALLALNELRLDFAPWLAASLWTYQNIDDANRLAIKAPVFSATLVGTNSSGKVAEEKVMVTLSVDKPLTEESLVELQLAAYRKIKVAATVLAERLGIIA